MGSRFSWLVALAVVVLSGVVAAPASASLKVLTTLKNETKGAIRFENDPDHSSFCWNIDDLAGTKTVAPGASVELYSSIKTGANTDCVTAPVRQIAYQPLWLAFQQPNGQWTVPIAVGSQDKISNSQPDTWSQLDNFQLYRSSANNVYFKDAPTDTEWFPISPTLSGTSGLGLFCLNLDLTHEHDPPFTQTVTVKPAGSCATVSDAAADVNRPVVPVTPSVSARALGSGLSSDDGKVYNLLTMYKGACDLLKLSNSCSAILDDSRWDWSNVTADLAGTTAINPPPTSYEWTQVNPPYVAQDNETNVSGSLSYTFTYSYGSSQTTSTTEGFKVGTTYEYKDPSSMNKWGVSAEFNFSATQAETTGSTQTTSVSTSVATQPDGWTYLFGFDGEATNGFPYVGDLTLGNTAGEAEPLVTPVPANFGYSPATVQPCIGYTVGTADVSGSVEDLDAEATADGYRADDPTLTSEEREFLGGAPLLSTADGKPCPGSPDAYRSGFQFLGTGTMSALAYGGVSNSGNSWFPDLGSITTCAYYYPNNTEGRRLAGASAGTDSPCGSVSDTQASDTKRDPGIAIRASNYGAGAVIKGAPRSELVFGDREPHKIILGPGTFNIVKGGSGAETVIANGKTALVQAGSGHDVLHGGTGYDTLIGGSGRDVLVAGTGRGTVIAGSGDTSLVSGPHSRSALVGGPGNDKFVIHGTPRIGVFGGSGNDTYYLYGKRATTSILERAGGGIDTLYTDHSLTVPMNIEVGKALAPGITLTGVRGTEELTGSPKGHDTLVAGPGEVRMIGAGADNTLILNGSGFDEVTGGSGGGNRFVVGGRQFNDSVARGRLLDSASEITDFAPAKGDRLVLSAGRLGSGLASRGLTLVEGRDPRPADRRPTLMFDTARRLVTFDPDGAGPRAARVVAILDGVSCSAHASTKTAAASQLGIHFVRGARCLPTTAFEITH